VNTVNSTPTLAAARAIASQRRSRFQSTMTEATKTRKNAP
jgi:hypothetical protein